MRPARTVSSKNDPQAWRSAAVLFRHWRSNQPNARMIVGCHRTTRTAAAIVSPAPEDRFSARPAEAPCP